MRGALLMVLATLLATSVPTAHAEARRANKMTAEQTIELVRAAPGKLYAKGGGAGAAKADKPGKGADKKAAAVKCDVTEFVATKTGKESIDPKLIKHKAALQQPPLSAFDTFKVTGEQSVTVAQGKTGTVKVTATLDVLFKGEVKQGDKTRLQFELTIDDPSGSRLYRQVHTQDSGATVIQTGGNSNGGKIFLAVTCSAQ